MVLLSNLIIFMMLIFYQSIKRTIFLLSAPFENITHHFINTNMCQPAIISKEHFVDKTACRNQMPGFDLADMWLLHVRTCHWRPLCLRIVSVICIKPSFLFFISFIQVKPSEMPLQLVIQLLR